MYQLKYFINLGEYITAMCSEKRLSVRDFADVMEINSAGHAYTIMTKGKMSDENLYKIIDFFELDTKDIFYIKIMSKIQNSKLFNFSEKVRIIAKMRGEIWDE